MSSVIAFLPAFLVGLIAPFIVCRRVLRLSEAARAPLGPLRSSAA